MTNCAPSATESNLCKGWRAQRNPEESLMAVPPWPFIDTNDRSLLDYLTVNFRQSSLLIIALLEAFFVHVVINAFDLAPA
jgi:hypothetical protein